jgi:hypothetical protein
VIPRIVLIASLPFTQTLGGEAVARAIARGFLAAGLPAPDLCPIESGEPTRTQRPSPRGAGVQSVSRRLDELDFDARMRSSRAVVLAQPRLEEGTLRGSPAFEIATRARQSGVPAYAVVGENALVDFDARIMDLQRIFEAASPRALAAAGRKLAEIV